MFRKGVLILGLTFAGCDMPRDPEGTLDRVRGGTLRVGISQQPPWTEYEGEDAAGIEAALIEEFAEQIDATIQWTAGAESELLESLQGGSLDVVIGGLKDSTPWSKHVALTRPYLTAQDDKHVIAVRQGENRWLLELEEFLREHRGEAMRWYQQAPQT